MSQIDDDPEAAAAALGLRMVVARPDLLQLDIDYPYDPEKKQKWKVRLGTLNMLFNLELGQSLWASMLITVSKSGNTHVYVKLIKDFTHSERLFMQLYCDSDPTRERLSFQRLVGNSVREPSILFETPGEYDKVMSWLEKHKEKDPP